MWLSDVSTRLGSVWDITQRLFPVVIDDEALNWNRMKNSRLRAHTLGQ